MDVRRLLTVDAVVLVAYVIVANPAVTGIALHEWLGFGALAAIIVHVAMHFDYLVETARSSACRRGVRLAKLALDATLVIVLMLCCASGLMVSGAVLPAFGLYAEGYYFWDPLHAVSAKLLLALLLVHVAANGRVVVAGLKRKDSDYDE
ncbi:DUF4405 domain-containing protein [Adlercreutzia sp. ZJ473]|uniref:DUF4405 domain-containing protein n=1 Tax=Adlercreutzia sp. ZJ473 TaxID=2722822 RepID=UPI001555D5F4|nr:DUF4405 domain-containing protein [Adlercreutzia sp. ZJ473]